MRFFERLLGDLICWTFACILAASNLAYLKTLGHTQLFGEHTQTALIVVSVLFDVSLIWATRALVHHYDRRNRGQALFSVIVWVFCAGVSGHSAYQAMLMFTASASSETKAGNGAAADIRDSLRKERAHLDAIQAEMLRATKARAPVLQWQESTSKTEIERLRKASSEAVTAAGNTVTAPLDGFAIYIAIALVLLPVAVSVAAWDRPSEAPQMEPPKPVEASLPVESGPPAGHVAHGVAHSGPPQQNQEFEADIIPFRPRDAVRDEPPVALAAQVMALVAHGRSQRQIADALGISRTTVQRYLKKAVKH
jgi:hypothetical protein